MKKLRRKPGYADMSFTVKTVLKEQFKIAVNRRGQKIQSALSMLMLNYINDTEFDNFIIRKYK